MMTQAKMDRRVRRTRRRLHDAMLSLVLEKDYELITIQDITDRADLSRATFYLHYRDKHELLANSLEEMFDELVASLKEPLFQPHKPGHTPQPALAAFQHVAEYSALYKALLLGDRGVTYVIYREIQYIARIARHQIQHLGQVRIQSLAEHERAALLAAIDVAAQHVAGSLFALILWWLENDMPHSPQDMAARFYALTLPGVLQLLQMAPQSERG